MGVTVLLLHKIISRFPHKEPERLQKWLQNLRRKKYTPSLTAVLCSAHFEEHCFYRWGKQKTLEHDAVPTKFDFRKCSQKVDANWNEQNYFLLYEILCLSAGLPVFSQKHACMCERVNKRICSSPHINFCTNTHAGFACSSPSLSFPISLMQCIHIHTGTHLHHSHTNDCTQKHLNKQRFKILSRRTMLSISLSFSGFEAAKETAKAKDSGGYAK